MIDRYSREEMTRIWSEENKFSLMLEIELLVAEAQAKILNWFPIEVVDEMRKRARFSLKRIKELEEITNHDIVAFIQNISETLGPYAAYLHKGLTSNDLIDTSFAVQIKQATDLLVRDIDDLLAAVKEKAIAFKDLVCIARTHGVHAEPTVFGLKFALFYDEISRAKRRLILAGEELAVGKISGAVGNYAHNPPEVEAYVCDKLGIRPAEITTQVVPRDRHASYLSVLAVIGGIIERFALEVRHLQRTEVREAEEPFRRGQKGSSAMPHKRNPILCERLSGQARLLRSYALASMESIALWHERDISHSSVERIVFPDATILLDYMLTKVKWLVNNLNVYPENIIRNLNLTRGLIFSQSLLSALMNKGVERMNAYEWVQQLAMRSWTTGEDFRNLVKESPEIKKYLEEKEIEAVFSLERFKKNVGSIYKRLGLL